MTIDIYNVQQFAGTSTIQFFPGNVTFFANYQYNITSMVVWGGYYDEGSPNRGLMGLSFDYKDQMYAKFDNGGIGTGSFNSFLPIDIEYGPGDYGGVLYAAENEIIVGITSGTDFFIVKTKFDGYVPEPGQPHLKQFSNWRITDIIKFPQTYSMSVHRLKNYYVLLQQREFRNQDGSFLEYSSKYMLADSSFNIIKDIYTIPNNNTGWPATITITDSGFYTVFGIDGGNVLGWDGPGSGINIVSQLYNQNGDLINVIERLGEGGIIYYPLQGSDIPMQGSPYKIGNKLFASSYSAYRGAIGRESDIYRVYKYNGRYYTNTVELPEPIRLIPDISLRAFVTSTPLVPRALASYGNYYFNYAKYDFSDKPNSWSPILFYCSNYPIVPNDPDIPDEDSDYTAVYLGYTKNPGGWNLGRIPG